MLDDLYNNVGKKIKNFAKVIFIIEAIGAIITGLVLLVSDEDLMLYGLLTLIGGPIVAWIGSWILYAFGELVEDIHAIRNKYYPQAKENAVRKAEEQARRKVAEKARCEAEKTIIQSVFCGTEHPPGTIGTKKTVLLGNVKFVAVDNNPCFLLNSRITTADIKKICAMIALQNGNAGLLKVGNNNYGRVKFTPPLFFVQDYVSPDKICRMMLMLSVRGHPHRTGDRPLSYFCFSNAALS